MAVSVKIEGDKELLKKLGIERYKEKVSAGLQAAALAYKGYMATYPPSPRGRPQFPNGFKSMRQQRFFFAALKDGRIEVPYRRGQSPTSERYNTRWSIRPQGWHTVRLGNNARYAELLGDEKMQARYHKETGWPTDRAVEREQGSNIIGELNRYLQQFVEDDA